MMTNDVQAKEHLERVFRVGEVFREGQREVTLVQFQAFLLIALQQPLALADMRAKLGILGARGTVIMQRLAEFQRDRRHVGDALGLIRVERDANDDRMKLASLSAAGHELVGRMRMVFRPHDDLSRIA